MKELYSNSEENDGFAEEMVFLLDNQILQTLGVIESIANSDSMVALIAVENNRRDLITDLLVPAVYFMPSWPLRLQLLWLFVARLSYSPLHPTLAYQVQVELLYVSWR